MRLVFGERESATYISYFSISVYNVASACCNVFIYVIMCVVIKFQINKFKKI